MSCSVEEMELMTIQDGPRGGSADTGTAGAGLGGGLLPSLGPREVRDRRWLAC